MPSALSSGSKSNSKKAATQPSQPQRQRNYAITVGAIVIVLKTLVPGSLYIITGDGKRKCIEIKIDAANVGPPRRTEDEDVKDINVTATVRTLSVDGGPVKDEETEVKVEELEANEEKPVAEKLSAPKPIAALAAPATTPQTSTKSRYTNGLKITPSGLFKRRTEPTSPPPTFTPSSRSSTQKASTSALPHREAESSTARKRRCGTNDNNTPRNTDPAPPSPTKKRHASEMDSSDPSNDAIGGSPKRVRVHVAAEKPQPQRSPRRGRSSQTQSQTPS
ncbi:hypothetical protein MVEN_02369900 [Mycena venus]|uniref:Uncharacterized protein n=1 Tax=Mycena venus TaxID=2733690 RepID=A0A8H7CEI9_9AGAR|nr:hypothetical protein MVEN_02369900 [Mycena venus]